MSGIWARRALIGLSVLLVLAGLALAVSETLASARLATLGSRTSVASREGIAIDLLRLSQPLALATLDFRDAVIGGDRAARADPAARLAQDLSALHRLLNTPAGRRLELAADEKKLQSAWSRARSAPDGWGSLARVSAPLNDIVVLLQDAGDTSDFSYERSHATQSLADIGINDLPSSLMFPRRNDLLVAHLRAVRGIPLDLRLGFNSSSAAIIGNFDLEQDHLAHTTASLTKSLPAAQHGAIARFLRAAKGYVQAGSQFGALVNTVARAPRVDAKTQSRLKALSARAEAAANALYAPTIGMLRADLAARSASFERSRFARALALLGIVLLIVGALSLALLIAGMRSSRALEDAQRERERLAAELARQETERALHLSEAQFRAVFDGATMGIAILNNRGRVVDANAVYRSIVDIDLHLLEGHESDFAEVMNGARDAFTIERRIGGLHGEMWVDVTISGVTDASGAHQLAMCTFADKTTIKQQEHRLNFQRLHDALTGLPNRRYFDEFCGLLARR
ncbi:MAG TPA: hypothetical protein VMV73_06760, partial [Candidatus Dormibacteraeota bacterium]|nr:hypothetical protein [Candidatus Dormibacteraeota bacterium]